MIKFLLITLLLSASAFAQDHLREEFSELVQGSYRAGTSDLKRSASEANDLLAKILSQDKSYSRKISIPGRPQAYEALEIIPSNYSISIGRTIAKWKKELNDLAFVYAPEVLLPKNVSAIFDPKGKFIGISHDLILNSNRLSSATIHETYHAYTFKQVIDSQEDLFAGYYEISSGSYLSPKNNNYYMRFGSIDEIIATSLSVYLDTMKIIREDDLSFAQKESLLGEVYHSLLILGALSSQMIEVTQRLGQSSDYKIQQTRLELGKKSKTISQLSFNLDSYSREVAPGGGRTYMASIPNGAKWHMYFKGKIRKQDISTRLSKMSQAAERISYLTSESMKCIYVMIQYPRLERSDLNCLEEKAPQIFLQAETFKKHPYPLKSFL